MKCKAALQWLFNKYYLYKLYAQYAWGWIQLARYRAKIQNLQDDRDKLLKQLNKEIHGKNY